MRVKWAKHGAKTSPCHASLRERALESKFLWLIIAPLERPVVPEYKE